MSFGGFLRRLSFTQSEEDHHEIKDTHQEVEPTDVQQKPDEVVGSSIFAGTSKLIDSMNARTSGIASGISSKLDQLKRRASQEALSMIDKGAAEEQQAAQDAKAPHAATEGLVAALPTTQSKESVKQESSHLQRCGTNPFTNSADEKSGTRLPGRAAKPRPPKPPPPRLPRQNTNPFGATGPSRPTEQPPLNRYNSVGSYQPASESRAVANSGNVSAECQKIVNEMGNLMSGDEKSPMMTREGQDFVQQFVDKIVQGITVSQDDKAKFGEFTQSPLCRSWFVECMQRQNLSESKLNEAIFYTLVQFFAVVLFECHEAKDYIPAKDLMILAFRIHAEVQSGGGVRHPLYLYTFLKDQPIWQAPLFWDTAFQSSVEEEQKKSAQSGKSRHGSIPFQQLSAYMCHMKSFPIKKELCQEFLAKQTQRFSISSGEVASLSNGI